MSEPRGLPRRFARWVVHRYYRRIRVVDADRVPEAGPVLLCANHANSLVDSVIVGITARRPVRFLAKAPLFDFPVAGSIMRSLGMVPTFRGRDDPRQVRNNLESLDTGSRVLLGGHAMGVFPEGISTDAPHLARLRSGAARMALQAVEGGRRDVVIVPIGIAYERKERFRSDVLVRVAEPLPAAAFLDAEDGNVARARRQLTAALDARLKSVVIHLENPDWEPWLGDLEVLVPPSGDSARKPLATLRQRKRIADAINYFWNTDRPRALAFAADIDSYRTRAANSGLSLHSDVLRYSGATMACRLLGRFLWLALLFPPALLGTVIFLAPFVLVRRIDRAMGAPGRVAVATHTLIFGVPIYTLWHLGMTLSLWRWAGMAPALAWAAAGPLCGALALTYRHRAARTARLLAHELTAITRRPRLLALRQQRDRIRATAASLEADFDASHGT